MACPHTVTLLSSNVFSNPVWGMRPMFTPPADLFLVVLKKENGLFWVGKLLMWRVFSFHSGWQRAETDDHHRCDFVVPLSGSGSSQRCKFVILFLSWLDPHTYAEHFNLMERCCRSCSLQSCFLFLETQKEMFERMFKLLFSV